MLKFIATDVVISKGYNSTPALRFSDSGDNVRFRVSKRVYDTRAENNTRWLNIAVKAFGDTCERVKKMQLKEGSHINLIGEYDEETWADKDTNEEKSQSVIILKEVEYASSVSQSNFQPKDTEVQQEKSTVTPEQSDNFMGYEPYGSNSFFD